MFSAALPVRLMAWAPEPGLRLGPRQIDGDGIGLDLAHAGTELTLHYDKPDPFTLRGSWQAGRMGEWGLRFWVMLTLSSAGQIIALALLLALTIFAEFRSLSALIERTPWLRGLDSWGRTS